MRVEALVDSLGRDRYLCRGIDCVNKVLFLLIVPKVLLGQYMLVDALASAHTSRKTELASLSTATRS